MEVHDFVVDSESFLSVECPILIVWCHRGIVFVGIVDGEDHLSIRNCVEEIVSHIDNSLPRIDVLGILGEELVAGFEATFYALGVYI